MPYKTQSVDFDLCYDPGLQLRNYCDKMPVKELQANLSNEGFVIVYQYTMFLQCGLVKKPNKESANSKADTDLR